MCLRCFWSRCKWQVQNSGQCRRVGCCFAGHLNINGCKMSKSLKNFISIRSVFPKHPPYLLPLIGINDKVSNAPFLVTCCMGEFKMPESAVRVMQQVIAGDEQALKGVTNLICAHQHVRTRRHAQNT